MMTIHPTDPPATDRPPADPGLALIRALNSPPYDLAAGKTGTPLGEAVQLLDAYRAAVLREAADEVFSLDFDQQVKNDEDLGSVREAWDLGTVHARDELLRMADGKPEASDG